MRTVSLTAIRRLAITAQRYAPRTRRGTAYEVEATIRALAGETVLVTPHWGPNMARAPIERVRRRAPALLDAGASLVAGHSAHVFHGVEGRVLWDLGDFLDDYAVDPVLRNDRSFLFLVEADEHGLRRLRLLPVQLPVASVDLATGEEPEANRERMRRLCEPLGTELRTTEEGLELTL